MVLFFEKNNERIWKRILKIKFEGKTTYLNRPSSGTEEFSRIYFAEGL